MLRLLGLMVPLGLLPIRSVAGATMDEAMAKLEPAPDPSMEDILASIRRIITEDEGARKAAPGAHLAVVATSPPLAEPPSGPAPEPIWRAELPRAAVVPPAVVAEPAETEPPMAPSGDAEPFAAEPATAADPEPGELPPIEAAMPVASPSVETEATRPAPRPQTAPAQPAAAPQMQGRADPGLLSARTDAAVEAAFDHLTGIMLNRESRTLEDIVKDMMRPMLKDWLDDNLPPLVERLVREEIHRVSRGRR